MTPRWLMIFMLSGLRIPHDAAALRQYADCINDTTLADDIHAIGTRHPQYAAVLHQYADYQ